MNIKTVAHPSEILYDLVLEAPKDLLQISNYELFKDIILNKKDLTEQSCEFLAKVFQTSKEYWMNMQAQWDEVNSILSADKPCPDMSEEAQTEYDAFTYVLNTSGVSRIHLKPSSQEFEAQNLYVMTEQAYKYLLSKCTEDEAWDLGWLGYSEKHATKVDMNPKLKSHLSTLKLRNLSLSATHVGGLSTLYQNIKDEWYYLCTTDIEWKKSVINSEKILSTLRVKM